VLIQGALFVLEIQRDTVDTVAFAGRFGAVIEHMAEMALTVATDDFGSGSTEAVVRSRLDGIAVGRIVETRPASAGAELFVAREQHRSTASTPEHAVVVDF